MRGFLGKLVCVMILSGACTVADALPRFALMAGAKCGSCHVNPAGGQMRNDYGLIYSLENLPMRTTKADTAADAGDDSFSFSPKLSDNISIGADYRSQLIIDQKSGSSTFHMMTMSLYGSVRIHKQITFFTHHPQSPRLLP